MVGPRARPGGGPLRQSLRPPARATHADAAELTHSEMEATLITAGAIYLPAGAGLQHAYIQRLSVEVPVGLRRWYVGAGYEVAGGNNGTGFAVVGGNLALDGRTVWATTTGLAFGGGMSLMFPAASYDPDGPASRVALAAATLRPWDVSYSSPTRTAFAPTSMSARSTVPSSSSSDRGSTSPSPVCSSATDVSTPRQGSAGMAARAPGRGGARGLRGLRRRPPGGA